MGSLLRRILRVFVVAAVAAGLYFALAPLHLSWLVVPVALLFTGAVTYRRWRRGRARARASRWAEGVLDAALRPAALREVEEALARLDPADPEGRSSGARLVVLLAELLDADGRSEEARARLDALDEGALSVVDAAIVRHGRAAACLRGGDAAGARAALRGGPMQTGEGPLDLRLELLDASAGLELGEAQGALTTSTRVRQRFPGDEALVVEARVVRAAALDALDNREDALEVLRSLGPATVRMLLKLGQPRVRSLAQAALEGAREGAKR